MEWSSLDFLIFSGFFDFYLFFFNVGFDDFLDVWTSPPLAHVTSCSCYLAQCTTLKSAKELRKASATPNYGDSAT